MEKFLYICSLTLTNCFQNFKVLTHITIPAINLIQPDINSYESKIYLHERKTHSKVLCNTLNFFRGHKIIALKPCCGPIECSPLLAMLLFYD